MHDAWWWRLASPEEWDADTRRFLVVRDCEQGAGNCSHAHNCGPPDEDIRDKLGLFWGAQYTDCTIDLRLYDRSPCYSNSWVKGKDFFRSMVECKMRSIGSDFCRVCSDVISEAIRNAIYN
jgi:hypothetical protein